MSTFVLTAGAVLRRQVRTQLLANNIKFVENKGFLESDFIITADERTVKILKQWVYEIGGSV